MTPTSCPSCGGALVGRRAFRMSPNVVAVGACGLAVSAMAVLAGLVMVFSGIDRLQVMFVEDMAAPQLEVLRVAGVPDGVIRAVAGAEALTAAQRTALTDRQVRLVAEARQHVVAAQAAAAGAADTARFNSIVVAVVGAVTGVLSGLLLTRRRVRQCARCGAVAPPAFAARQGDTP